MLSQRTILRRSRGRIQQHVPLFCVDDSSAEADRGVVYVGGMDGKLYAIE